MMSFLASPIPSWKEIFGHRNDNGKYWQDVIWTSKSAISIRLIAEETLRIKGCDFINIWIPEYFCGETEEEICSNRIRIIHYPVTRELNPDWNAVKDLHKEIRADIFLFVHYFGVFHDPNRAGTFCKQNNIILIEDCAHCLYKYQNIGRNGDFAIFSCHKLLPVPDGALIHYNANNNVTADMIYESIKRNVCLSSNPSKKVLWRLKKSIQHITRKNKPYKYERKIHYYDKRVNERETQINVSSYAKKIIDNYGNINLKQAAYIRRENCDIVNYLVLEIDQNIISLIPDDCECPYLAVFSLSCVSNKEMVIDRIQGMGFRIMHWPDLPNSVCDKGESCVALELSKDIIVIPIHQDIRPQSLAKLGRNTIRTDLVDVTINKLSASDRERWDRVFNIVNISNITQHWSYGDVKDSAEGWEAERFVVCKDGKDIGLVQILGKRILGRKTVYRINKGPLLIDEYNRIDFELSVLDMIRKSIKHPHLLFCVPYSFMTPENYVKTIKAKWRNWDIFGFPTGVVDLRCDEEEIRKSLNSKWRNQLKTAEKYNYKIFTDNARFEDMVSLYEKEQTVKEFKGVSTTIIKLMNEHEDRPLRFFYILNENGDIIAFDIFYRHGKGATYYIGWNSEEGRKHYLNNYILFHAAIELKKEGVIILDLGGLDYIHTEAIAKFKEGMSPHFFRQMGEFVKIG